MNFCINRVIDWTLLDGRPSTSSNFRAYVLVKMINDIKEKFRQYDIKDYDLAWVMSRYTFYKLDRKINILSSITRDIVKDLSDGDFNRREYTMNNIRIVLDDVSHPDVIQLIGKEQYFRRYDRCFTREAITAHVPNPRRNSCFVTNPLLHDITNNIKQVIYNDPATIILWKNGTKTVVKCGENEKFDKEKGFAMAMLKAILGNEGNYYNKVKKFVPVEEAPKKVSKNITVKEYAKKHNMGESTVRHKLAKGEIPGTKDRKRHWVIAD